MRFLKPFQRYFLDTFAPIFHILNFIEMTIKSISVILTLAFLWAACGSDAPQQSSTPSEASQVTPDANTALPQETMPLGSETAGAPPATQSTSPTPATTGGAAKINPPHGQPGHVCGVPVGSPLDGSAATTSKSAQPAAQPAIQPVPQPSTTGGSAATAPGTNPPHGQPGHVCGTPVGAPLPKQ